MAEGGEAGAPTQVHADETSAQRVRRRLPTALARCTRKSGIDDAGGDCVAKSIGQITSAFVIYPPAVEAGPPELWICGVAKVSGRERTGRIRQAGDYFVDVNCAGSVTAVRGQARVPSQSLPDGHGSLTRFPGHPG